LITDLISAGHDARMVLDDYSEDELQLYWEAVIRHRSKLLVEVAWAVRAAQHANKKDFKSYVKAMEGVGRQLDRALGRSVVTIEDVCKKLDQRKAEKDANSRRTPDRLQNRRGKRPEVIK